VTYKFTFSLSFTNRRLCWLWWWYFN